MENFKKFLTLAVIVISFIACNKSGDLYSLNTKESRISETSKDGIVRIIEKLENPYTVDNMRKAYESLQQEGKIDVSIEIMPTHLYVRFAPKDSAEYEKLTGDSTLTLFSFPLDCSLTEGETFIDQDCTTEFGYRYTRVPIGYVPIISEYTILDDLFMPNEEGSKATPIDVETWFYLLQRSELLTKNIDKEDKYNYDGGNSSLLKDFKPAATIKVFDDVSNTYIPVEGAIVRARHFLHWNSKKTDANGYCQMPDKFKKVWYSIIWEGDYWDIRSGSTGQAYYNGPNGSKSNWNLNIGKGGLSFVYAHIHRACWTYWHNTLGIKVPCTSQRVKLGAYNENGRAFHNSRWIFTSLLHIYRYENNGIEVESCNLYQTTIHELAHESHRDMGWAGVDKIVFESWAVGVTNSITTQFYSSSVINFGNWQNYTFSYFTSHFENKYTPVVIDLIDNVNQRATHSGSTDYPIDRVSGYAISQIEAALKNAKTLQQWRNNLYNKYNNPTKEFTQELFNNYINMQ